MGTVDGDREQQDVDGDRETLLSTVAAHILCPQTRSLSPNPLDAPIIIALRVMMYWSPFNVKAHERASARSVPPLVGLLNHHSKFL